MALLSKACIYGIRASIYIAIEDGGNKFVPISKIAKELYLSSHFLTKILQELTKINLLESYKGPNGGVKLTKPAKDISLMEIVEAIDGTALFEECALGLEGCGHYYPCPLHYSWLEHREALKNLFITENLETLADSVKTAGFRLRAVDLNFIKNKEEFIKN
jgi:Rrf2 family protein